MRAVGTTLPGKAAAGQGIADGPGHARKVAGAVAVRRHHALDLAKRAVAQALIGAEEKRLVLDDRTAGSAAKIVRDLEGCAVADGKEIAGVESAVLVIPVDAAADLIGSAAGSGGDVANLRKFRVIAHRADFDFVDRLRRGEHFDEQPVRPNADGGNTVDRGGGHERHGSGEGELPARGARLDAGGSRDRVKNGVGSARAEIHRQVLDLLRRFGIHDGRLVCSDHLGHARDTDLRSRAGHFQPGIHADYFARSKGDVPGHDLLESRMFDQDFIGSRIDIQDGVIPGAIGYDFARLSRTDIFRRDGRTHNHRTRSVSDRAANLSESRLRRGFRRQRGDSSQKYYPPFQFHHPLLWLETKFGLRYHTRVGLMLIGDYNRPRPQTRTVNVASVRWTGRYSVSRSTGSRPALRMSCSSSARRIPWLVVAPAS